MPDLTENTLSGFPFEIRIRAGVLLSFFAIAGVAWLAQRMLNLSESFFFNVMSIFALGASLIVVLARKYLKSRFFGPANCVTLFRAALTALLFAMIVERPSSAAAWGAVITAALALILDGVDGWLARNRGEVSSFGARFDMETDALLILGISILVWQFARAGSWILAAGLMRYIFVAAGGLLPWMKRPLPPSLRRRIVFVAQAVLLLVCLVPSIPHPLCDIAALVGLGLLTGSFAVDIAWLVRGRSTFGSSERDDLTVGYGWK